MMTAGLGKQKERRIKQKTGVNKIEIDNKYKKIIKLLNKKKYSQARRLAEKLGKSDAKFLCDIAGLFVRLGLDSGASHLYKEALKANPENSVAHYNYGLYLKKNKRFKEAEQEFNAALEYDDSDANYYSMLGNTLLDQNKIDAADEQFNLALDHDSKNLFAFTGLGNISLKRGNLEYAEKIFKHIIKLDKSYPVPYLSLLLIYNQQGREKDAKKILKRAGKANIKISIDKEQID